MIETASGLSQRLNAEMSEMRQKQRNVECEKWKLIEKKIRGSCSSYEEGQGVCLGAKASIKEEEQEEIQR